MKQLRAKGVFVVGVLLGVIEESDKVVQVLSLKNSRVQVGETVVPTNPRVEALETVFDEDLTSAEVASHELSRIDSAEPRNCRSIYSPRLAAESSPYQ